MLKTKVLVPVYRNGQGKDKEETVDSGLGVTHMVQGISELILTVVEKNCPE